MEKMHQFLLKKGLLEYYGKSVICIAIILFGAGIFADIENISLALGLAAFLLLIYGVVITGAGFLHRKARED